VSDPSSDDRIAVLVAVCAPVLGARGVEPPSHLPIDGWREWRRLKEGLEAARHPSSGRGIPLKVVRLHPPTLDRLRQALSTGAYRMVHIIGYVPPDGLLRMEKENGREDPISPSDLADAFRGAGVEIALLSFCSGSRYAEALLEAGVGAVVTAANDISDPEAARIAGQIYPGLGWGQPVAETVESARKSLAHAYAGGSIPPLEDWRRQPLAEYGRKRAEGILVRGKPDARLPLDLLGTPAAGPDFDPGEKLGALPYPEDRFIGRGSELVEISDAMEAHRSRMIVLTGIGGIGKSSLAVAAALRNSWRFVAVTYCTAKDDTGPRPLSLDVIFAKIEATLGLERAITGLPHLEAKVQRAAELLNRHPHLLVLDNLEVLDREQTAQLASFLRLLDPHEGSLALLTLRPEHFPPLVDQIRGGFYALSVESLASFDALALLCERLGDLGAGGKLPSTVALEELAEAAHRHPLLLRFAAASLAQPDCTREQVRDRLRGLRGRDLQEEVEDMIGKMCDDLARREPQGLELVQALLVFSGGAASEALRFVWCGGDVPLESGEAERFEDLVQCTRGTSLLECRNCRYGLHPLVRQYVERQRPPQESRRNQWAGAHVAYFLDYGARHSQDYDAMERERLNLFAAMDAAEQMRKSHAVASLAKCVATFLFVRGYRSEAARRLSKGLGAARQTCDRSGEASLLHELGAVSAVQGDYAGARKYYRRSLTLREELSDKRGKASTLHDLGVVSAELGDYASARECCRESLRLDKGLGNKLGEASTLHELGVVSAAQGDYAGARKYYRRSLRLREELSDKRGKAATLLGLGAVSARQGDYAGAREYYRESLRLDEELGDKLGKVRTLNALGAVLADQRDYAGARECYRESLRLADELGDKRGKADTLHDLGVVSADQQDYAGAREYFRESLRLDGELGNKVGKAATLRDLGGVCAQQGDYPGARKYYQKSLGLQQELGDKFGKAATLRALGTVCGEQGDYAGARECYRESLRLAEELSDKRGKAETLHGLGVVCTEQEDYPGALEYHREVLKLRKELGDEHGKAVQLHELGRVCAGQGDYVRAREYYCESLRLVEELGDRRCKVATLNRLADLERLQGNIGAAEDLHRHSVELAEEIGSPRLRALNLYGLALCARARGAPEEARRMADEALCVAEQLKIPLAERIRRDFDL